MNQTWQEWYVGGAYSNIYTICSHSIQDASRN